MISGEYQDFHAVEARRATSLPMREPGDDVLQPAEAAGRLGEPRFAARDRSRSGRTSGRKVETCCSQSDKRGECSHHSPRIYALQHWCMDGGMSTRFRAWHIMLLRRARGKR
jgi:hypothetical protein